MVMGQGDSTQTTAQRDLLGDGVDMLVQRRARVDEPGWVGPNDPRIGSGQRERAGVGGPQAEDPIAGKRNASH
jgi:hypothetical protein